MAMEHIVERSWFLLLSGSSLLHDPNLIYEMSQAWMLVALSTLLWRVRFRSKKESAKRGCWDGRIGHADRPFLCIDNSRRNERAVY